MKNHRVALAALLFVAGLVCSLALPVRRAGLAPAQAPAGARGTGPEEAAFAALVAGSGRGLELASDDRRRLLETLRSMGPSALARFLVGSVAEKGPEEPRLAALECLGGSATRDEVCALVRLATPGEGAPSSALRGALRAALSSTLERDQRAFGELVRAWRIAGAPLRAELLASVAQRGDPAGLELLAWVATFEGPEFHRLVAEACLGIAPRAPAQQALERLESLCGLLRSEDGVCVQTVSCALARAHVEAAIPAWMDLLDSQSRGTRERARRSLEELTGLALGTARARWLAWYESERSWYEEEAPAVLAELDSAEDARVLAALRTLAPRRLEREGLSAEVARLLEHATPAVRLSACSALESLGSSRAVPALSAALADDDAAVARRAWSALRRLTGLELPQDEALWRARFPEP